MVMLWAVGVIIPATFVMTHRKPASASAETVMGANTSSFFSIGGETRKLRQDLESAQGELNVARAKVERAEKVMEFSSRYGITAGLAGSIFDASLREGVDPDLGFRLVRLESEFNERATSKVGAMGLMQLMPSTAVLFEKGLEPSRLYDRETNLRIGFRYLRILLDQFKGNASHALLAYNRGEFAVLRDVRAGVDPGNGYDTHIMKGYKGKPIVQ